uniref:Gustatory receptor n=1 Tax=Tetranychus urticae TaxID=32264 RepID=T1KAR3_TETUR
MARFILSYYCYSKMKNIKNIRFGFSIKSISKFSNLNVTKSDLLRAIDDLEHFERSTRTFDRSKSFQYFQLQSLIILLLNIMLAMKFLLLSITDSETIRLYAGDIFVSSSETKVLNYFCHMGAIMPCMGKIFLLYLNQSERKSFLDIFVEYKESLKGPDAESSLLSTRENLFRKQYYFLIKSCNYAPFVVVSFLLIAHTSMVTINYSSLKLYIMQIIHIAILGVVYYNSIASGIWFIFILVLAALFACNSIDSLITECSKLTSFTHYTWANALSFYHKSNLISNWLDCINMQFAWIFIVAYVYLAFHNILIFFYLTQFKFGYFGVRVFLIFINVLTLTVLYSCNYLGALVGQKTSLLHLAFYRISIDTGNLFDIKVALKKLHFLEQIQARKIGFYIGNYIYLDNNNMLLLTLECGSLYLLFCSNINRNNQ